MKPAVISEIIDLWELQAAENKDPHPGRREALRECADLLRMMLDAPLVPRVGGGASVSTVDITLPRATGVMRDLDSPGEKGMMVFFNRRLSDDEMRHLHDTLRSGARPGPNASGDDTYHPMATAPRDGTIVRLLVQFDDHSLEDSAEPQWTIGSNTSDNTGIDTPWQFAGWCWTHDRFTEGEGRPLGWLPMLDAPAHQPSTEMGEDALRPLFEAYMSEGGKWGSAIQKTPVGGYLLLRAATAWEDWKACAAALADAQAGKGGGT